MKALSVKQPFAGMIAEGFKTIEFRTWKTSHRGPLLICASKRPNVTLDTGEVLPTGCAVCKVDVVDCRPFTEADLYEAGLNRVGMPDNPGFAWVLENPRPVKQIPVTGRLSLFTVDLPA